MKCGFSLFHVLSFQINNVQLSSKSIQTRYEERDQELFNMMKRLSEYELEIGALKDENADLSDEIASYQKDLTDSEAELQKIKKQNASTKGELEEVSERMNHSKDEMSNLQRILAEKDSLIEMQRKELFEKDADVETLKTAKKILGKDVNSTKEQLIVHKEKVCALLSNKSSTHYLNDINSVR
jgi:chromosome segregation ATPase